MVKPTPGPWEAIPNDDGRSWDVWGPDPHIEAPICDVLSEANARVIATVPELREIAEFIQKEKRPQFEMPIELLVMVRDALHKIKGEDTQ